MKAYRITTPFRAEGGWEGEPLTGLPGTQYMRILQIQEIDQTEGGFVFAVQPHREVRPES